MKLSKKAAEARCSVLKIYPTATVLKYHSLSVGRYVVFVQSENHVGLYLESNINSSSSKEKAWIDAHKYILHNFLNMLHY